jgi:hypothetical protein
MIHKSKRYFLFGMFLVSAFACSKSTDDNCVKTVSFESSTPYLTKPEQAKAELLFTSNHIDYSRLQFIKLIEDSQYTNIKCFQYVNGLKVFTEALLYHFENNHAVGEPMGDIISSIDIGSEPKMDTDSVAFVFLSKIKTDDPAYLNIHGCFLLEFGYYDMNVSTGKVEHDFIKAWRVTIEGRSIPFCYIDDNKETMIYYDNGSRY